MPFLKEIGLFKRNTLRRSLSSPNLKDLTISEKCEHESTDFGQNHFRKLIGKLTLADNHFSTNETMNKRHLNRQNSQNHRQEFELIEFNNEKTKFKVEEELGTTPHTAYGHSSVSLQINKELTSRIKSLDSRLKEKDTIIDEYFKRLAQIYVGFKVNE